MVVVASGFNAEPAIHPSRDGEIQGQSSSTAPRTPTQAVLRPIRPGDRHGQHRRRGCVRSIRGGRACEHLDTQRRSHRPADLFGIPIQLVAMLATRVLPSATSETLFPRILDLALGNLSKHGIRRPREGILWRVATSAKIPVIDVGTVRKISEGAIRIEPGISAITADGAIFCGGGVGKFDAIIPATGYRPNYRSFLQADDIKNPTDYPPARQNTDSTIYFVGFKNSVMGCFGKSPEKPFRSPTISSGGEMK